MANRTRVYALLGLVCVRVLIAPAALAVGPEDAEEWADKGAISVHAIMPENIYVPINHIKVLEASAFDRDCYRVGNMWYDYDDDVISGNTAENHHMWWTADEGEFPEMDRYGTSAKYQAPDYSPLRQLLGLGVNDVIVTVFAVDFNRGAQTPNTYGFADATHGYSQTVLVVWQVMVGWLQAGTISDYYDGPPIPSQYGRKKLGWIAPGMPGTPPGVTIIGYGGKTQVTGIIPQGPDVTTGYQWYQDKSGHRTAIINGVAHPQTWNGWVKDFDHTTVFYVDTDSRHNGQDVRQIFVIDAPKFKVGINNDGGIITQAGTVTSFTFDMHYRPIVKYKDIRISNSPVYHVNFTLDVIEDAQQNKKWHVVGDHTPAQ